MVDRNCWLLLEKSDETRVSKGIDAYRDKTGEVYHYDSMVPNHKKLSEGDLVIIRKEYSILGVGRVGSINIYDSLKTHRRCTKCRSTDIRERSTKLPKWKCGKCSHEFTEPITEQKPVVTYDANIIEFAQLNAPPSVQLVKQCASNGAGVSSQLSILRLDWNKILNLIEGFDFHLIADSGQTGLGGGQGFGLSQAERKAVELRAMEVATKHYQNLGWVVIDRSRSHPYDLFASKESEVRYIEVKGTTGSGKKIILTHGEVKHVKQHVGKSAIVVVSNIRLKRLSDVYQAEGGVISKHECPWHINDAALLATQYIYEID